MGLCSSNAKYSGLVIVSSSYTKVTHRGSGGVRVSSNDRHNDSCHSGHPVVAAQGIRVL